MAQTKFAKALKAKKAKKMISFGILEAICLVLSIGVLLLFSIEESRKNKRDKDE